MIMAWQNGLRAAHFGDTVLLVPKKIAKKLTIVFKHAANLIY